MQTIGARREGNVIPRHLSGNGGNGIFPGRAVSVAGVVAALVCAAAGFGAVVALRAAGGLVGWAYLVLLALMIVLTPSARSFSLRVLIGIAGLAGTAPFLWWIPGGVLFTDRGTLVLALAAAGLCGSAGLLAAAGRQSLVKLIPEFRGADALPLAGAAASVWTVHNYLFSRSLDTTLFLLTRSWDFAPHFNMFNMIRNHGSVIAVLPAAPDGTVWTASSYPQGYHALLATLGDIAMGPKAMDVAGEVTLFLRLVGISAVLGTVLVISALTALPALRRRLALTVPLTVLAGAAWIVGPGAIPVFNAFPNFGLAVALCITVIALVHMRSLLHPLVASSALILALVGVAHGWVLLLLLCLPAVIVYAVYLLSLRSGWGWAQLAVQVGIIGVGVAGVAAALWQLRKMSAAEVLNTTGGMSQADPGETVVFILANAGVVWALIASRRAGRSGRRFRFTSSDRLLATPLYASVLLIVLAVFQLASADKITYYFHKSLLAVELVAVFCVVIGSAEFLLPKLRDWTGRKSLIAVSVLAGLGAVNLFGAPYTGLDAKGLKATAFGSQVAVGQDTSLSGPLPKFLDKLRPMAVPGRDPYIYVGHDAGMDPMLMAQWSLALQGAWSEGAHAAIPLIKPLYKGPNRVPDAIDAVLESSSDLDVAVDPDLVPSLRQWKPEYAERITTWQQ